MAHCETPGALCIEPLLSTCILTFMTNPYYKILQPTEMIKILHLLTLNFIADIPRYSSICKPLKCVSLLTFIRKLVILLWIKLDVLLKWIRKNCAIYKIFSFWFNIAITMNVNSCNFGNSMVQLSLISNKVTDKKLNLIQKLVKVLKL